MDRRHFEQRWPGVDSEALRFKPWYEDKNSGSRNVLVIDTWMIHPDKDSGSYRMLKILQILKLMGWRVTFASGNLEYEEPYVSNLREFGIEVLYYPFVSMIEDYIQSRGRYFDVILLSRTGVASRLIDHVRNCCPKVRIIYDTVDLHFLREQRMAELEQSDDILTCAEYRKTEELTAARKADITLVVSEFEQQILAEIAPDVPVEILSNIHEVFGLQAPFSDRKGILFIGSYDHLPNVDAVEYYVNDILPGIRRRLPGVKTFLLGSRLRDEVRSLACDDVIVPGYVPDIAPYFNQCRVFVAPIRYGAGVKGKVNMSMSYGLPVVATRIAAEGMHLTHETDVLIGNDSAEFIDQVVRAYKNENLWLRLSKNGLANVDRYFSMQAATHALKRIL